MLYKVYAKNCIRPAGKRIVEATQEDLNKVLCEIVDDAWECGSIALTNEDGDIDDKKYSDAFEKVEAYWNKNKCISSGDYEIVDVESFDDIQIPNKCESDTSIIF